MYLPTVLRAFLHSEKAVASGLLVVVVTIFVALGVVTPQQWMDYTQVVLGIYVSGKTIQGATAAISRPDAHR
jgi:hypothetical protein